MTTAQFRPTCHLAGCYGLESLGLKDLFDLEAMSRATRLKVRADPLLVNQEIYDLRPCGDMSHCIGISNDVEAITSAADLRVSDSSQSWSSGATTYLQATLMRLIVRRNPTRSSLLLLTVLSMTTLASSPWKLSMVATRNMSSICTSDRAPGASSSFAK